MGYSPAARLEYLRKEGIDPVDIYVTASEDANDPYVKWHDWKQKRMDAFILGICADLKKIRPATKIVVLATTNALSSNWRVKENQLEDWPNWIKSESVDRIALESDWAKAENSILFSRARETMDKTQKELDLVVSLRRNGKLTDPLTQLLNLQGQKFSAVLVEGNLSEDIPKARSFIDQTVPEFKIGME